MTNDVYVTILILFAICTLFDYKRGKVEVHMVQYSGQSLCIAVLVLPY